MEDTYGITPHLIERWAIADKVEVAGVTHPDTSAAKGERSLLVFADEEKAETFRRGTGLYPASEGFEVVAVDAAGLRNVIEVWGYESVALCGLEPGGGADCFDAGAFCELLEDSLR
jgi:hypothetical protein